MLTIFIEEVIFRLVMNLPLLNWSLLRIFIGANIISLICSAIFSFFGRIGSNILICLTAFLFTIYALAQAGFHHFLGSFISLSLINQASAVQDFIGEYLTGFNLSTLLITIPFIILLLFYIFIDRRIKVLERNDTINFADKFDSEERKKLDDQILAKRNKKRKINSKINALVIALFCAAAYYVTLIIPFMQNDLQIKTSKELLINPDNSNLAINQFGSSMYLLLDAKSVILPSTSLDASSYDKNGYQKPNQAYSDYSRVIDDSLWEKVAENEKRQSYKRLNNYFLSQEITDENDFTGIFKDKNLILIMMSSTNNIALNEEYFPNIYKLYNEGWSWINSYTPRSACSTGNNELASLTSLYPLNNLCTLNQYRQNIYPESLYNLFNQASYQTTSYHNYTEQFYYRNIAHTNLGSSHFYGAQELGIPYNNSYNEWPSDNDLITKMLDITKDQNKFMVWLSTASANFPYDKSSELGDKYLDLFSNTNYNTSLKRYLSKLKEFDNAIGSLLKGLESQGKLDDTVIVLYTDHYPYGLNTNILETYFNQNLTDFHELDRTPFIIYNTKIQAQQFDEYTSLINLTPTIANLFALDYDPRLYMGQDLLSSSYENRVIFADGSWKDAKATYDAITGKITYVDINNNYSNKQLQEINQNIKDKISMSNLAIKNNYFNYLKEAKENQRVQNISD